MSWFPAGPLGGHLFELADELTELLGVHLSDHGLQLPDLLPLFLVEGGQPWVFLGPSLPSDSRSPPLGSLARSTCWPRA